LPKLPVPELEETLAKYLKTLRPLLNDTDYNKSVKIVEEFKNGVGRDLHQKLVERANKATTSWLIDW
jgi:hypothetical protein